MKARKGRVIETVLEACVRGSPCDIDTAARLRAENPDASVRSFVRKVQADTITIRVIMYVVRART